jgi:subtilase family serine protease
MSPRPLAASVALLFLASIATFAQGNRPAFVQDERPVFGHPAPGHVRPPVHISISPSVTSTIPHGKTPSQVRTAYGFSSIANRGKGQTIAIVDAFDHPSIEADLGVFSSRFGLPACTTANGCFTKVYAAGVKPRTDAGWALEIALDVEWAHAIAPDAKILLVESTSDLVSALLHAVDVAVQRGASTVSMSWGGDEFSSEAGYDSHFAANGVTFLASSGDDGTGVGWPAVSQHVVSVGGTSLFLTTSSTWSSEKGWSGSGGGRSLYVNQPSYQSSYGISGANGKRTQPDVAFNGNPSTGFAVYDSVPLDAESGWFQVGGTSAGTPQWAALFAIVNSMRRANGKSNIPNPANQFIYPVAKAALTTRFHDITTGTNGTCPSLCTAKSGWDFVTGIGTPKANALIPALVAK